jgi:inosine-uridine nucleoside N-ribohydrolase
MVLACLGVANAVAKTPVRVIFDTDLGADVDDAGAVAVLHALADRGEADILAMGLSVTHRWSAPCLDAMNTYYGRPDIPIGVVKGKGVDDGCKYAESIAKEFPHDLKSPDEAADVVSLYRQVLAKQPDNSVVLVTVGFLTNVANL